MAESAAPVSQSMIRVEAISEEYFRGAVRVQNDFLGARKRACGFCSYRCCPTSEHEFSFVYRSDPRKFAFAAVALNESNEVVGFIDVAAPGIARDFFSRCLHQLSSDEFYIEMVGVLPGARGHGVGTELVQWSENLAREKGAKKLTLGVVAGNPAIRLYERQGFVEVNRDALTECITDCMITCVFGCPHLRIGGKIMQKQLSTT